MMVSGGDSFVVTKIVHAKTTTSISDIISKKMTMTMQAEHVFPSDIRVLIMAKIGLIF
jgi:hypothetical protein